LFKSTFQFLIDQKRNYELQGKKKTNVFNKDLFQK
jgi:hypothetical protein